MTSDTQPIPSATALRLLALLRDQAYSFITPTPATHARVLARRASQEAASLRDVLGWSLPFRADILDDDILACLTGCGMLERLGSLQRATVRVSSLGGNLYLHSAYPTDQENAVFFGPDTYRFASFIARELAKEPPPPRATMVDIGTGAGAGAITAASLCPQAQVLMTDINRDALHFAKVNAEAAGVRVQSLICRGFEKAPGPFDLAMINPPYIIDDAERTYRDGGGMHGAEASFDLTKEALSHLHPGGRILLYTGSAIIDGRDALRDALFGLAAEAGAMIRYHEADPDVFGEELSKQQYSGVERIALINCVIAKRQPLSHPKREGNSSPFSAV